MANLIIHIKAKIPPTQRKGLASNMFYILIVFPNITSLRLNCFMPNMYKLSSLGHYIKLIMSISLTCIKDTSMQYKLFIL